jgi:ubiquinone/menaquinone biosynthesis C-methylase UbiE
VSLGRRKISLSDQSAWVFNRMADVYDARPPYPAALIDALEALRPVRPLHVLDVGAGIGHLALPLVERGHQVTAIEPARSMLTKLKDEAAQRGLALEAIHAQAEALPCAAAAFDLVVIADAVHFLDAERTGHELSRVLRPDGALAVLQVELADSPYMQALQAVIHESAPRRVRRTSGALTQLSALAGVSLSVHAELTTHDALTQQALQRLLASVSFLGPAMNAERTAAFHARIAALGDATWSRRLTLHAGIRTR